MMLPSQVIKEHFFETLRTQEQLGYIVTSGRRSMFGVQGIRFLVQSEKHSAFVDNRIELFIASMEAFITDLTDEQFKNHVASLTSYLQEKAKTLSEEAGRYWQEIADGTTDFQRRVQYSDITHYKSKYDVAISGSEMCFAIHTP